MNEPQEQNLVRTVMQNEYVWIGMIIAAVMGFVVNVILPIQKMQIQLAQIQADVADNKTAYNQAMAEHQLINQRLDIVETEIKPLLKQ